jgi:hypothetical protein
MRRHVGDVGADIGLQISDWRGDCRRAPRLPSKFVGVLSTYGGVEAAEGAEAAETAKAFCWQPRRSALSASARAFCRVVMCRNRIFGDIILSPCGNGV